MATTSAVQTAPLQTSGVQPDAARRRKRSERRFQSPADVIVFIALCLGAFTMLLPLAWMLSTSLKTQENVFSLPPQWIPDPAELGNRSEEHTSELQSRGQLVCRLLLEKKKTT